MVRRRTKLQSQLLEEATWRSGSDSRWHPGKGLKAWLDKMQIPGKCDLLFTALNSDALLCHLRHRLPSKKLTFPGF